MGATFLIEDTFVITGRGLVVAGQIVDGTLQVGDRVALPGGSKGTRFEIVTGVESGHGPNGSGGTRGYVGLVLGELPQADIPDLRDRLKAGTRLRVEPTLRAARLRFRQGSE